MPADVARCVIVIISSHILETPVTDDHFREQLHELNHKIAFVREQAFRDARSCADVKDILNKLKFKVCCILPLCLFIL